jgi:GNAT superfamily N-acetyltransferase
MIGPSGIRPARESELPFLWDMLYEAAAVNAQVRAMGKEKSLALPSIQKYLAGFGKEKDFALLAIDEGELVGAAWYRCFSQDDCGYGFVASDIPELTIAVGPGWRGQGIGTRLLEALLETARTNGHRAISLSVDRRNPALRLYERFGFQDASVSKATDTSVTMVLWF